jgi:hypothetical protein
VGAITFWPHCEAINSIKSIRDLRDLFPDGKANTLNWCFLSTSGIHGSYATLDDMHAPPDADGPPSREVTVLVVHPRLVVMRYGNIAVRSDEDERWLRGLVQSTLDAVRKSQGGNLPKKECP